MTTMTETDVAALAERVAGWLTPERWCQGRYAADAKGRTVGPKDKTAVRWCASGAAYALDVPIQGGVVVAQMMRAYHARYSVGLVEDNDTRKADLSRVRGRLRELAAHLRASQQEARS